MRIAAAWIVASCYPTEVNRLTVCQGRGQGNRYGAERNDGRATTRRCATGKICPCGRCACLRSGKRRSDYSCLSCASAVRIVIEINFGRSSPLRVLFDIPTYVELVEVIVIAARASPNARLPITASTKTAQRNEFERSIISRSSLGCRLH